MSFYIAFRGNPAWLRYGGYFSLVFGAAFGLLSFQMTRREYLAQHWPVAPGKVLAAEIKSRTALARHGTSTIYWASFKVLLDVPAEECRPREPWILEGSGRTQCRATFNSLEDSQARVYEVARRHPAKSLAQFHYEPHGLGVRFVGEPLNSIYPWSKIVGTFAVVVFGFALLQLGRREADKRDRRMLSADVQVPPIAGHLSAEEGEHTEFIDLNVH